MKLQDFLHYYMGCNMTHKDNLGAAYILHFDVVRSAIDHGDLPVLRRLEGMTRDEMKAIWQLIFNSPFHENGSIRWIDKEERNCCKRWVMSSGVERVGIEMNGNVWADSDLSHWKFNPNIITHYLIQQSFDLFGLIPAGLAIDIKTLTP